VSNLFSMLYESTIKYPEKAYVVDKGIKWTYSDIYKKTAVLAECMKLCGVNRGDRVLIYLDNSVEYIASFFSVLLTNGIIVPINKNTAIDNIKYIVQNTSPKVIISGDTFIKRLQGKIDFESLEVLNIDRIWSDTQPNNIHLVNNLTQDGKLPAVILYTSGTTRMPKGVTLTHKNLIANTESILKYLELTDEDSVLATINFSYSYGNSLLLTHTKAGGTIFIENRVSYPVKVLEQMYATKASGFSTVGSYINLLLKQDGPKSNYLQYLRYITFAGESTSFEDIVALNKIAPNIKIFVMYGQTEASARLSYLEPSMLFKKAGSIGNGIPGVTLRVVNNDGEDILPGEIGEIIAYGDNIMKGYWNNEEDTKTVIKDRWLYTGDLATVDEDGYIFVKGRKDDIIKYMGHRISPVEIEAAINTYEHVLESAVVGFESCEGKQIKAFVVLKNKTINIGDVNSHIKKLLPPFKRPQLIEFIDELPRTANGKIKRNELRRVSG
jgi:long-chain acyl-CoA synthetase